MTPSWSPSLLFISTSRAGAVDGISVDSRMRSQYRADLEVGGYRPIRTRGGAWRRTLDWNSALPVACAV
jgi:hypothetical protein